VTEYSVEDLLEQHQELIDSMLDEGILDEQFSQLQMLQDESTPDFVEEVVTLYFDDSDKLLENLTESLKTDPIDYKVVDGHVHQFKGSSSSVGAQRIKKVCLSFRPCCDKQDKQGCLDHLVKVKEEFNIVRTKLGKMLELEKQIIAAGGQLPFMEC
jgi:histidine-containing phosphotransfer protein